MCAMRRITGAALLTLSVTALAACATMDVNSYAAPEFEPRQFRTYAWGPTDGSTGDARLDNNEFFDAAVRADVERALAARGFVKVSGEPDILVHYHASFTQKMDLRDLDLDYDYCDDNDCRPSVYDAGTLIIDLVRPGTNKLVWRGWAEGSMDVIDNQDLLEERVAAVVARIAERLPRAM